MKIIATVRTRNEKTNIERFCHSYRWANCVLVADANSCDDTVLLAKNYPNVRVELFDELIERNGYYRSPHGKHINFLIELAEAERADWIIFDDCDCVPSYALKADGRKILTECDKDFVIVNRVYIYGTDRYFEKLTMPFDGWDGSLWAWRTFKGFRADETDPWSHYFNLKLTPKNHLNLQPPYCLLHYFYPDDEYMKRKIEFYRKSGEIEGCRDPKEYGGTLLPLEEWMRE